MITADPDIEALIELGRMVCIVRRNRRILNFMEPNFPCVVCRGQLISGRCPECDPT